MSSDLCTFLFSQRTEYMYNFLFFIKCILAVTEFCIVKFSLAVIVVIMSPLLCLNVYEIHHETMPHKCIFIYK